MCDRKKSIVFSCITFWYSKKKKERKKKKTLNETFFHDVLHIMHVCQHILKVTDQPVKCCQFIGGTIGMHASPPPTPPFQITLVLCHSTIMITYNFFANTFFFFFFFLNSPHRAIFSSLFDSQLYHVIWWLHLSANTNKLTLVSKLKLKSNVVVLITKF